MNDTQQKPHPRPHAEGGGGYAEREKREKKQGSLVDENQEKDSGVPLSVPPPPD